MAWADEPPAAAAAATATTTATTMMTSDWELALQYPSDGAPDEPMDLTTSGPHGHRDRVRRARHPTAAPTMTTTAMMMQQQHQRPAPPSALTSSASCPSFTSLYDIHGDDLLEDLPDDEPLLGDGGLFGGFDEHPLLAMNAMGGPTTTTAAAMTTMAPTPVTATTTTTALGLAPAMAMGHVGYDFVLDFQQQHQNALLRHFPHPPAAIGGAEALASSGGAAGPTPAAMTSTMAIPAGPPPRRSLHMSASFTSLASMETEYKRRMVSKRKKDAYERWHKQQRHKSFDSTTSTTMTTTTSMEFPSTSPQDTYQPPRGTDPSPFLDDVMGNRSPDAEMVGFSIDEFPTTFTSDATWPMPLSAPPPLSLAAGQPFDPFPAPIDLPVPTSNAPSGKNTAGSPSRSRTPTADDEILLSDQERANVSRILDAIRDFDSPRLAPVTEKTNPSPKSAPKNRPFSANEQRTTKNPRISGMSGVDSIGTPERTSSPAANGAAGSERAMSEQKTTTSRDRFNEILTNGMSNSKQLTTAETQVVSKSSLFQTEKAPETAGSLWLLLHVKSCEDPTCSIAGCDVMRRVLKHCRGCELPLGSCRDPCNEAKIMLLHYAKCSFQSAGSTNTTDCVVCTRLGEIDQAHKALKSNSPPVQPVVVASPSLLPMGIPLSIPTPMTLGGPVPIAPQPAISSPALRPAGSKHVPIQPNPLPTPSNPDPLGMRSSFPRLGYSLALYLEQTSAAFRAELKSRVEKWVTAAASQDLIRHMQKKTRLRSLDDLRSEARTVVLSELERELHLQMHALNWAASTASTPPGSTESAPNSNDSTSSSSSSGSSTCNPGVPSYLLNVAAAGFAAFYTQQATLQAAMSGLMQVPPLCGPPMPPRCVGRQSSTGLASNGGTSTTTKNVAGISSSPSLTPKNPLTASSSGKKKETAMAG